MGLFNSKKEKNKYTADATWSCSAEKVIKAIQMGVPGFTVIDFNRWTNSFSLSAFPDYDINVRLIPISFNSTRIIAEVSMHIGVMNLGGWNAEAWSNKQKIQSLMDAIAANLKRL